MRSSEQGGIDGRRALLPSWGDAAFTLKPYSPGWSLGWGLGEVMKVRPIVGLSPCKRRRPAVLFLQGPGERVALSSQEESPPQN